MNNGKTYLINPKANNKFMNGSLKKQMLYLAMEEI